MTATERIDEIGVSRGGQMRMYLVNLDLPKSSVDGNRYEYQVLQFCRSQLGHSERQYYDSEGFYWKEGLYILALS
jgi:hypothetical protein